MGNFGPARKQIPCVHCGLTAFAHKMTDQMLFVCPNGQTEFTPPPPEKPRTINNPVKPAPRKILK